MASFVSTDNFQFQLWVQVSQQVFLSALRTSGEIMRKHFGEGETFFTCFSIVFQSLSHGKFRIHKEFSGFENSVDYEHLRTWRYTSSLLLNLCSFILLLFQLWFVLLIMNGWPFSVCFFSCVQSMCCFLSGDWNFYYYHPMINLFPGW